MATALFIHFERLFTFLEHEGVEPTVLSGQKRRPGIECRAVFLPVFSSRCTIPRLSARITQKEDRSMKRLLLTAALIVLSGCGGSPHAPEERYFLIGFNIKVPYWQEAGAGLRKAAAQLQVKAEMTGPDTFDPKQQQAEFQRVAKLKPSGILVS